MHHLQALHTAILAGGLGAACLGPPYAPEHARLFLGLYCVWAVATRWLIPHRVLTRFAGSVVLIGLTLAPPLRASRCVCDPAPPVPYYLEVLLLVVVGRALVAFVTFALTRPAGPPRAVALTRNSR